MHYIQQTLNKATNSSSLIVREINVIRKSVRCTNPANRARPLLMHTQDFAFHQMASRSHTKSFPRCLCPKENIILPLLQTSMGYILLDVKHAHTPNMQRGVCDLHHFLVEDPACRLHPRQWLYISGLCNHYDIVASAPLAFTTLSPDFCAGIATGRPLAFAVKLTISRSIKSLVSRAKSSTSDVFRPFVSIGFKTATS